MNSRTKARRLERRGLFSLYDLEPHFNLCLLRVERVKSAEIKQGVAGLTRSRQGSLGRPGEKLCYNGAMNDVIVPLSVLSVFSLVLDFFPLRTSDSPEGGARRAAG